MLYHKPACNRFDLYRMKTVVHSLDITPLKEETTYLAALKQCSKNRQEKANCLKEAADKRLCVGAWLLLMHMLKRVDIDVNKEPLAFNEHGKPYLFRKRDVHFNLSHSGNTVLCAISGQEIGCDIEQTGRLTIKIARRCFHTEELTCCNAEDMGGLTTIWTLKESFAKCIGSGLGIPFSSFSVCSGGKISERIMLGGTGYNLYRLSAPAHYAAALCTEESSAPRESISCQSLHFSDLMQ